MGATPEVDPALMQITTTLDRYGWFTDLFQAIVRALADPGDGSFEQDQNIAGLGDRDEETGTLVVGRSAQSITGGMLR